MLKIFTDLPYIMHVDNNLAKWSIFSSGKCTYNPLTRLLLFFIWLITLYRFLSAGFPLNYVFRFSLILNFFSLFFLKKFFKSFLTQGSLTSFSVKDYSRETILSSCLSSKISRTNFSYLFWTVFIGGYSEYLMA